MKTLVLICICLDKRLVENFWSKMKLATRVRSVWNNAANDWLETWTNNLPPSCSFLLLFPRTSSKEFVLNWKSTINLTFSQSREIAKWVLGLRKDWRLFSKLQEGFKKKVFRSQCFNSVVQAYMYVCKEVKMPILRKKVFIEIKENSDDSFWTLPLPLLLTREIKTNESVIIFVVFPWFSQIPCGRQKMFNLLLVRKNIFKVAWHWWAFNILVLINSILIILCKDLACCSGGSTNIFSQFQKLFPVSSKNS